MSDSDARPPGTTTSPEPPDAEAVREQRLTSHSRLEQVIGAALSGDDLVYLTPALEKVPLSAGDPGYVESYLTARLIERLGEHRKVMEETSLQVQSVLESFREAGDLLEKSIKETIETSVAEELVKNLDTIQTEIQTLCRELALDETRAAVQVRSQAIQDQVAEVRRAIENAERAKAPAAPSSPAAGAASLPAVAAKLSLELLVKRSLPWIFGILIGVLISIAVFRLGHAVRPLNSTSPVPAQHPKKSPRSAISTPHQPPSLSRVGLGQQRPR